jgi:hypothetical protein
MQTGPILLQSPRERPGGWTYSIRAPLPKGTKQFAKVIFLSDGSNYDTLVYNSVEYFSQLF